MPPKIQLSVAEPCHENWNQMSSVDQGRFCQSCQKTVTDFSGMNDREILKFLSNLNTDVCGRFTNNQLDRTLVGEHKKKVSWAYVWNFIIATFLTTGYANAQIKPREKTKASVSIKKTPVAKNVVIEKDSTIFFTMGDIAIEQITSLSGVIRDSITNLPIPFASIQVNETDNGIVADSSGKFTMHFPSRKREITLTISAVGYEKQDYGVAGTSNKLDLYLQPSAEILEEVVITGYPAITCRTMKVGAVSVITEINLLEKAVRTFGDWTAGSITKKEVKLYPNPVLPGATITVSLSLKDVGDHTIEILDASGRLVYRGQITMQSKDQNILIPTSATWTRGMYWVRVMNKNSKQLYNSKLMLQ